MMTKKKVNVRDILDLNKMQNLTFLHDKNLPNHNPTILGTFCS